MTNEGFIEMKKNYIQFERKIIRPTVSVTAQCYHNRKPVNNVNSVICEVKPEKFIYSPEQTNFHSIKNFSNI